MKLRWKESWYWCKLLYSVIKNVKYLRLEKIKLIRTQMTTNNVCNEKFKSGTQIKLEFKLTNTNVIFLMELPIKHNNA